MSKIKRITTALLFIGILSLVLTNCKETPPETKPSDITKNKGFFVVNEGTFTIGNASLFYINTENEDLNTNEDLFKPANKRPLGDVFQSMVIINKQAWLVVNNSGKIEITDPTTSQTVSTLKGFKSPRHALEVMPGKVYVTDIYSNSISVVDVATLSKVSEIKCKGWTEELILHHNKVWITNHSSKYLFIANPLMDKVTDSIPVAYGGSSILAGKDGNIWLLCSGDTSKNEKGGLFCIDPRAIKVIKHIPFSKASFNPVKLKQNPKEDSLYFIYQGIYGFPKSLTSLPQQPLIAQPTGSSFYGLGIHPSNGTILVADALDFVSHGKIMVYTPSGQYIRNYKAGIVPSAFFWW